MLFNSLEFLVLFLPPVLLLCRLTRGRTLVALLLASSVVFYAFTGATWFLIPMFFTSILDYSVGLAMARATRESVRRACLVLSIAASLLLLGYFKYSALLVDTATVELPPGISFYTFMTMSYAIDVYRRLIPPERGLLNYLAFVSFFPHLVAGPLVRWTQLGPQIASIAETGIRPAWRKGVFLFAIGLCKKVLIADRIANAIDPMILEFHAQGAALAWTALLGYSLQIYFDFSGYSDMALGLAWLFGIGLPVNFRSPYKARNPSDFWQRWHITLSQWIRDYLYIPLGGNRGSRGRVVFNLIVVMTLGGLWHGANWTFACWGLYHGVLLVLYHFTRGGWDALPVAVQRALTFTLVSLGWVFFRSDSFGQAGEWFASLFGLRGAGAPVSLGVVALVGVGLLIVLAFKNPYEIDLDALPGRVVVPLAAATAVAVLLMNYSSKFIYYRF